MSSLAAATDPTASRRVERILTILLPVVVTAFALAIGLGLVAATGASVPDTISAFWTGAFGSSYAIGASLNRAVPFALVGLGFILAARANLTNVGGEGQIAVGGIFATGAALHSASSPAGICHRHSASGRQSRRRNMGRHSRLVESLERDERGHQHAAAELHRG